MTILLIDDNEFTNTLSEDVLYQAGVKRVESCTSAKQALGYLILNKCPDLIFLDINMPVVDGFKFLDTQREANICPEVKVAMLTSSNRHEDRLKANNYESVIAYLEKPLTQDKLTELLQQL